MNLRQTVEIILIMRHGVFRDSRYEPLSITWDLYKTNLVDTNFATHFEKIFTSQGLPIYYALLKKPF